MAHLNLRDHVIETTIAYVGAEADDGETNLAHVTRNGERGRSGTLARSVVDGMSVVSLDWRPRDGAKLNDCDLAVKLVATGGPVDAASVQRVLVDADGLVLMLDSDPEAADRNRHAVAAVRDALSRTPGKKVPVVVQVNRRDGADGAQGAAAVDVDEWPRVDACAQKGDGVMETLQRAVDVVVESMQSPTSRDPLARPATARAEGNPLLAALRQVLQATVSEQMAALEARLLARVESRQGDGDGAAAALTQRLDGVEARVERVAKAMTDAQARERAASREDAERLATRILAEAGVWRDSVDAQTRALTAWMERLESTVIEVGARATTASPAPSKADLDQLEARVSGGVAAARDVTVLELKEQRKALRDEVTRAVSAAQAAQKAVDGLSSELKRGGTTDAATKVAAALEPMGTKFDELRGRVDAVVTDARAAAERAEAVARDLQKVDARAAQRASETHDALRALATKAEERGEAVQTELTALVEELRKKKKTWFG